VESAAPAEIEEVTTTSIENYWMTVRNRESPSKESWYLHSVTTFHLCGDQPEFIWYTQYAKRDEQNIYDCGGRVAGKAIGYGDAGLRLQLL
jgi:hypothetical protein